MVCFGHNHRQVYQIDIVLKKRNQWEILDLIQRFQESSASFLYLFQKIGGKSVFFCDFPCQSKSINVTDCRLSTLKWWCLWLKDNTCCVQCNWLNMLGYNAALFDFIVMSTCARGVSTIWTRLKTSDQINVNRKNMSY